MACSTGGTITNILTSQSPDCLERDMAGALVYHLNVYRLARDIANLEERIRVTTEILAGIPRDTARTRHFLFRDQIRFLEDRLAILRKRYALEVSRIR
jgi:hypothetical protein